jgi:hypothetical protein
MIAGKQHVGDVSLSQLNSAGGMRVGVRAQEGADERREISVRHGDRMEQGGGRV